METIQPADPVKLLCAVLWKDAGVLEQAKMCMEEVWGRIEHEGDDYPFDVTRYYENEMGPGLNRRILAFEKLVSPESLPQIKHVAIQIETELRNADLSRQVNLDTGYMDHHKIVLASAKPAGQKIYMGDGIFADIMFRFKDGRFQPFEWTFPDFTDGRYEEELLVVRSCYMQQLRNE